MWVFEQTTGLIYNTRPGFAKCYGYSGHGDGVHNPALEAVVGVGPIPRGYWTIGAPQHVDTPGVTGPYVLPLTPEAGTQTFGRVGFEIHGDAKEHPGRASHGCVIAPRSMREIIHGSRDTRLEVV